MSTPPLARSALDRAAHRRRDQRWLADAWGAGRVLVVDSGAGGTALVRDTPPSVDAPPSVELVLLGPDEAPPVGPQQRLFLGVQADGVAVFALDAPLPAIPGTRAADLRAVGHLLGDRDAGLLTTAVALARWHATHRFSPETGAATVAIEGGWARSAAGGAQMFPRTDPAVIVLLHDGAAGPDGRCLLGHNAAWGGRRRRFSCLAGFVEPGESAEAAAVREVREEVDVEIGALRYVASQSWPFPGSLMLGFTAYADPAQPVTTDPAEIVEARWFTRGQIAAMLGGEPVLAEDGVPYGLPMASSIAAFLIESWLREAGGGAVA